MLRRCRHHPRLSGLAEDRGTRRRRRLTMRAELVQQPGAFLRIAQLDRGQRPAMDRAVAAASRLPRIGKGVGAARIARQHRKALVVLFALGDTRRDRWDRQIVVGRGFGHGGRQRPPGRAARDG